MPDHMPDHMFQPIFCGYAEDENGDRIRVRRLFKRVVFSDPSMIKNPVYREMTQLALLQLEQDDYINLEMIRSVPKLYGSFFDKLKFVRKYICELAALRGTPFELISVTDRYFEMLSKGEADADAALVIDVDCIASNFKRAVAWVPSSEDSGLTMARLHRIMNQMGGMADSDRTKLLADQTGRPLVVAGREKIVKQIEHTNVDLR